MRAGWTLLTIALVACAGTTLSKPRGSGAPNAQGGDDEYGGDEANPMPPPGSEGAGGQDAADAADAAD